MSERKIYTGKQGKTYTAVDPPLGQGGEGAVFKIQEDPAMVIKVFWEENRTPEREKKLIAMTDMHLPDNLTAQNTWPVDPVYENNKFAGFVMKKVTNSIPVNRLYMEEYKKSCTYDKRVFIAKNICAAVHSVHIAGQVVGDLNPKNVCVNPDTGMVTLVDTNSYHITDPKTGEIHRCEVGLPEYLAKEIQLTLRKGTTLKDAPLPTFTKETDNFALAVHIFALLMNGCHPFACARDTGADIDSLSTCKSSVALPQPIENICTGNFTFYNPAKGTKPPVYAPNYGMLPEDIRQLFTRAFVNGSDDPGARPDAVEWFKALDGLLRSLKKCKTDATHIFPANAVSCPWCRLEAGIHTPPPAPPGGNNVDGDRTVGTGTQTDPPLSYDELKILGESIEKNAGGKKNIKGVSRDRNCVILELKKKQNKLTAFADKSLSSITEDGNNVKYFFFDEGNAEGIELYINNDITGQSSDKGGGNKNNVNKSGKKSKKKVIIPVVLAAAATAAALITLFATGVLPVRTEDSGLVSVSDTSDSSNWQTTTMSNIPTTVNDTSDFSNNAIVGKWVSEEYDGSFIYTFNEDGSGNYNAVGTQMPFTYTLEGNRLSITYDGDTVPFDTTCSIKDNIITIKDSLDEDVVYKKETDPVPESDNSDFSDDSWECMEFKLDGKKYKMPFNVEEITDKYELEDINVNEEYGYKIYYFSSDYWSFDAYTDVNDNVEEIDIFSLLDKRNFVLPGEIKIGSSVNDVINAYGKYDGFVSDLKDGYISYRSSNKSLFLGIDDQNKTVHSIYYSINN